MIYNKMSAVTLWLKFTFLPPSMWHDNFIRFQEDMCYRPKITILVCIWETPLKNYFLDNKQLFTWSKNFLLLPFLSYLRTVYELSGLCSVELKDSFKFKIREEMEGRVCSIFYVLQYDCLEGMRNHEICQNNCSHDLERNVGLFSYGTEVLTMILI